jgi:NAD(P)H-hydrate epimerase
MNTQPNRIKGMDGGGGVKVLQDGTPVLLSAASARALDREASASWGLDPFALVEAAGRRCAQVLTAAFPAFFSSSRYYGKRIAILAGSGSNAADAMVLLRSLIVSGYTGAESSVLVINKIPAEGIRNPRSEAFRSLQKIGVPVLVWENENVKPRKGNGLRIEEALASADLIIDGIAGTGLEGPLHGQAAEMVNAFNKLKAPREEPSPPSIPFAPPPISPMPLLISIDVPSGNSDHWKPGAPIAEADATLAIEPLKLCLFNPAARSCSGTILPVGKIFPLQLIDQFRSAAHTPGAAINFPGTASAELVDWNHARRRIPPVARTAYKYERGVVEIRAGSPDAPGAARIAARGAQAVGAGLIRLIVDPVIHPVLAANAGGIMVANNTEAAAGAGGMDGCDTGGAESGRFKPDAILLGPGWGKTADREIQLRHALEKEAAGIPLILDADAILLAKNCKFHGNALLTPHPGELAAYAGVSKDDILAECAPLLFRLAAEKNAVILFKSHVIYAACPNGRLGIIDGMTPVLGMGGSGDLLAGFCAGIAARCFAWDCDTPAPGVGPCDLYICALAAASLLIECAKSPELGSRFPDPLELADKAADLAGAAWLPAVSAPQSMPFAITKGVL